MMLNMVNCFFREKTQRVTLTFVCLFWVVSTVCVLQMDILSRSCSILFLNGV